MQNAIVHSKYRDAPKSDVLRRTMSKRSLGSLVATKIVGSAREISGHPTNDSGNLPTRLKVRLSGNNAKRFLASTLSSLWRYRPYTIEIQRLGLGTWNTLAVTEQYADNSG